MKNWDNHYNFSEYFELFTRSLDQWRHDTQLALTAVLAADPSHIPNDLATQITQSFPSPDTTCDIISKIRDDIYWSSADDVHLRKKCDDICALITTKLTQQASTNLPQACIDIQNAMAQLHTYVHHLKNQVALAAFGYCPFSQVKNKWQAYIDIKKEAERRHRTNDPLTILLMRFDNLAQVTNKLDIEKTESYLNIACHAIDNKLRVFDDMYRTDFNEFLLLVKLTDKTGAALFARRIQKFLSSEKNNIQFEGRHIPLTPSFIFAEIIENDNLEQMIDLMHNDFMTIPQTGAIHEFIEKSPLERLAQSQNNRETIT